MVSCFVIGPIGNKFAPDDDPKRQIYEDSLQVFEEVIQRACSKIGVDPVRADQIAVAGEITEQVFRHLLEDDVVIADVSGGNPNVLYELGLRHTTGKLTIQIGEFGQLPFDITAIRTIQFSRSPRGLIDARNELEKALQVGLVDGQDPLTATRVWRDVQSGNVDTEVPALDAPSSAEMDDESPGLLETMLEIESGFTSMAVDANDVVEAIEQIGTITADAGVSMERATQSGISNSARLALVAKYAANIEEPVEKLEAASSSFAGRMETMGSGVKFILQTIQASESEDRPEGWDEFLDQLISMAESSREGMEGLNSFGSTAEGMGSLSRQLRRPGKKINSAVADMRRAIANIDSWERTARSIRDADRGNG
ncbi:hypothetical protein ACWDU8_20905 [Streptomyces sp. NPDC003388]